MEQVELTYDENQGGFSYQHIEYRVKKPLIFINGLLQRKDVDYTHDVVNQLIIPLTNYSFKHTLTMVF